MRIGNMIVEWCVIVCFYRHAFEPHVLFLLAFRLGTLVVLHCCIGSSSSNVPVRIVVVSVFVHVCCMCCV